MARPRKTKRVVGNRAWPLSLMANLVCLLLLPSACSGDASQFQLSVTVDFFGDTSQGLYTHETLDLMMQEIRDLGATRVYWLYYGELDQRLFGAGANIFSADASQYGTRSLDALGEPLAGAVKAAHKYGLEIYGVLKPYHTGISATYPEGSPDSDQSSPLRRIGGTIQNYNPFMARYPYTRIKRMPERDQRKLDSLPVLKIRLLKSNDSPTRITKDDLEIWTSDNNYKYKKSKADFDLEETIETAPKDVFDYYGELVTRSGDMVRVLTLSGFEILDPYVVVATHFRTGQPDFENTVVTMIEAIGSKSQQLPIVVATQDATWIRPRDYRTYGLEFDSGYGRRRIFLDNPTDSIGHPANKTEEWSQSRPELGKGEDAGFIAFARGKNKYLPTAPCEVYPEVQRLWMWRIDRMLDKGVDGVVLRVSAHGSLTDEPYAYGYNEPVIAAFRKIYDRTPSDNAEDRHRVARIRGGYYTNFVRAASLHTRARGKRFMVELHSEAFRSNPVFGQIMGFPANIEFRWRTWLQEGLADAVILRSAWYEGAEDPLDGSPPRRSRLRNVLKDPVVQDMLKVASESGIPVYLNRYIGRAIPIDEYVQDIKFLYGDSRVAGVNVYEFFHLARALPDGSALVPVGDRIEKISGTMNALRLRSAEHQ